MAIIIININDIIFQSICNLEIGSYLYVCSICYFLMLVQTWQNTNVFSSELTINTNIIFFANFGMYSIFIIYF